MAVAAVSIHGYVTLFWTRLYVSDEEYDFVGWNERPDGHFCTFYAPWDPNSPGVSLTVSTWNVGFAAPYWLITAFWAAAYAKSRHRLRFRILDLMGATSMVAVLVLLYRYEVVLPAVLMLASSTLTLVALITYRVAFASAAICKYFSTARS
jgi:hypothetical protein